MNRISRKLTSVCLTLTLLVTLFAPLAAPADARSINGVSRTPVVSPYWTSDDVSSSGGSFVGALAILAIKEDSDFDRDFSDGACFALTLTPGVKWVRGCYDSVIPTDGFPAIYKGSPTGTSDYTALLYTNITTDNRMELTIPVGATNDGEIDYLSIPLYVNINGTTGDIFVTIENIDSGVTEGTYKIAVSTSAKTTAVAGNVKNINDTGEGEIIRIDEYFAGALTGKQTLNLILPDGFAWDNFSATDITVSGGFLFGMVDIDAVTENDSQTLEIGFDFGSGTFTKGAIYINTPIKALPGAPTSVIEATVTGSLGMDKTGLVLGWYKSPTSGNGALAADVNGDGVVNGLDITALLQYFGN